MGKRLIFLVALAFSMAQAFCSVAQEPNERKGLHECRYCGMDLKHFSHSRMVLVHDRGVVGVCSINCAAINFIKDLDDPPTRVEVGDYRTRKLIDAQKAFWVIGGSKPGVMAERAKWAFQKEKDARAFIREYGGSLASYDEAMRAGYEDMYADMRKLKQMKLEHERAAKGNKHTPEMTADSRTR